MCGARMVDIRTLGQTFALRESTSFLTPFSCCFGKKHEFNTGCVVMCAALIQRSLLWFSTGAQRECPIEISPEKMVIRHQSEGQNVTCGPSSSGSRNIEGKVSWQVQHGSKTGSAELSVDPSKDWDLQPVCTATFRGIGTCSKPLEFTLYSKFPGSFLLHC